jgi:hypothetical protein
MRLMAFSLTTPQVLARTKTVTRRAGYSWMTLKPGQLVQAVEKGMGLKKGQQVTRLAVLRIRDVRLEPLYRITPEDVVAEGFPEMTPQAFVEFFCRTHRGVTAHSEVVRIAFEYADEAALPAPARRPRRRARTAAPAREAVSA